MEIKIRKAKPNESDIAFAMLKDAALWLKEKDINQWRMWLAPTDWGKNWIMQGFENGEFHFVCDINNNIIGMYRLQSNDELFWGKNDDNAAYIHQFTTKRDCKGMGIGTKILEHIERELKQKNIEYLRLDCSPVKDLCQYYESHGFISKGLKKQHDGYMCQLYQKKIT